jgi:hypothetical protein
MFFLPLDMVSTPFTKIWSEITKFAGGPILQRLLCEPDNSMQDDRTIASGNGAAHPVISEYLNRPSEIFSACLIDTIPKVLRNFQSALISRSLQNLLTGFDYAVHRV